MLDDIPALKSLRRLDGRDRRKFRRVIHETTARCMWADGAEFQAATIDLCGGGISLKTDQPFVQDKRIVVYIDEIGRLAGQAARKTPYGFAVRFSLVPQKRDRVVDQLTWLVNHKQLGLTDDRRSARRSISGTLLATFETGETAHCNVIDISLLGVALHSTGPLPPIGSRVQVGRRLGRCARYVKNGFAVEFLH